MEKVGEDMNLNVRFVGCNPAEVVDTKYRFTTYGQLVSIPAEILERVFQSNQQFPAVLDKDFSTAHHTDDELKAYAKFERHITAPQGFLAKREILWDMVRSGAALANITSEINGPAPVIKPVKEITNGINLTA